MKSLLTLLIALLVSTEVRAAISFTNITQGDVDKLEKEILANTTMHSVLPPSTLGSIFGFEIGAAVGTTKTPEFDSLAKRVSADASVPMIPHGGLVGAVSIPGGLTLEAVYLPKVSSKDLEAQQSSFALKYTITDGLLSYLPVNIAARGFYSSSEVTFSQTLSGYNLKIANKGTVTGGMLMVSPKLIPIIEPYVGLGYVTGKGTLSQSGGAPGVSIFANGAESMESSTASSQLVVGLDIRLLFVIGLGAEYSRSFGTDTYTGKFSLKF